MATAYCTQRTNRGEPVPGKIIVEHTNINPNKAAHIGHLRNAVLGDTFVRMLRASGRTVEVQNYIDNTGVQVADVVAGFHFLRKMSYDDVVKLIETHEIRLLLLGPLCRSLRRTPSLKEWRQETLHAIEHREGELVHLASKVSEVIVGYHLNTMARLGVELRPASARERGPVAQVLGDGLRAVEGTQGHLLRDRRQEQRLLGDARQRLQGADRRRHRRQQSDRALEQHRHLRRQGHRLSALEVRTAGQGLLLPSWLARQQEVYVTTAEPQPPSDREFGHGESVYNVIDSRQSYLQDVVVAGLRALGYNQQADRSIHFSYEMVALSPGTCVELGIELSEEDKKRPTSRSRAARAWASRPTI